MTKESCVCPSAAHDVASTITENTVHTRAFDILLLLLIFFFVSVSAVGVRRPISPTIAVAVAVAVAVSIRIEILEPHITSFVTTPAIVALIRNNMSRARTSALHESCRARDQHNRIRENRERLRVGN